MIVMGQGRSDTVAREGQNYHNSYSIYIFMCKRAPLRPWSVLLASGTATEPSFTRFLFPALALLIFSLLSQLRGVLINVFTGAWECGQGRHWATSSPSCIASTILFKHAVALNSHVNWGGSSRTSTSLSWGCS